MMTLAEMYEVAVARGIEADPRGKDGVMKSLARRQKEFDALPKEKQGAFDLEDLKHPFSDSRILIGEGSLKVDKVMAGIDIEAAEVVLADALNQKGAGIDLLIAHHPIGAPYAALHEVMDMQADTMVRYGVPVNVAEGVLRTRVDEIARRLSPRNHTQAVDAARLLGLAVMCTHTITDNLVFDFLEKLFAEKEAETVGDVMKILKEIPEYREAQKGKAGPMIFSGSERNRVGKIAPLEITGGTEGPHLVYEKLAQAGVGTIISMHASEEHRAEAQKHHINLIVAGHISSDSIGMNLLLDAYEAKGVEIVRARD
jgi:putative NIF3 family GTP cyclohydrolase 1 type 2